MRYFAFAFLTLALAGCEGPAASDRPLPVGSNPSSKSAPATTPDGKAVKPDNTAVNERDRSTNAKTPLNQDENSTDIKITADIRKAVLATEGMSVNARNAKIITSNGKVTLRGPVASAEEKAKVERLAMDIAGDGNVTNELEVKE